jgi:2-polyprenyl-3-methyl-5-hydroxy-6-metoxy-1,4-benzoquinol methylase
MDKITPTIYAFKPHPYSSHSVIISWLERFPEGTKVLDIGTASGYIGRMLQQREFNLYGLEPELEWVKVARPYYKDILCSDLEHADAIYLRGYQVVLLADVLEHIPSPEKELQRLISMQSTGTIFIISVPNVANIWIRLNLLFGKFDYTVRGIMDSTHLRFFTRKTFQTLLKQNGLRINKLYVTPIPLWLVNLFFENNRIGKCAMDALMTLTKKFPTVLGYQWIAQCEVYDDGEC